MSEAQEPVQDDLADEAADLIMEAEESLQENRAEQEAFLDDVQEEHGSDALEAECNIIGDHVVPIKAELNGSLMDRISEMDARIERLEEQDGRAYEFSEVADQLAQLLADVVDDPTWDKRTFYAAYEETNIDALMDMMERVFDSLKTERKRREGAADGFRQK